MPDVTDYYDEIAGGDASNVSGGGVYLNVSGLHLIEVQRLKAFVSKKNASKLKVAFEFKIIETDCTDKEKCEVGKMYTWLGDLSRQFGTDQFPDRDRLMQLVCALVQKESLDEDEKKEAFTPIMKGGSDRESAEIFKGERIFAKTTWDPEAGSNGFTKYEFFPLDDVDEDEDEAGAA